MLNEVVIALVAGGAGAPLAALVGWAVSRRQRDANYAQIVSDMSRQVAADLREDNEKLEAKFDRVSERAEQLEVSVAALRDRVVELSEAVRIAVVRLTAHGAPADDLTAVLHGRTNGAGR